MYENRHCSLGKCMNIATCHFVYHLWLNIIYFRISRSSIIQVSLFIICRYIVKDLLGHGTFGQVAKCWDAETNSFVAVKIIKNQPAYYQQALVEVSILTTVLTFYFGCIFLT